LDRPRALIVLALALAAALTLAACGGDDGGGGDEDPQEVLQAVEDSDQSVESGNLSVDMNVSVSGDEEGSFELSASGPFQGGGGELPQFDIAGDFSAEGGGQSFSADGALVSTGDAAYLEYQDTAYELPAQLIDQFAALAETAQQQQGESDACQAALEEQGLDTFSLLTDLSNEGTEDVEGAETIRITGGLDFAKVSELVQASADIPACANVGQQLGQAQLDQVETQLSQASDLLDDFEIGLYVGQDDDLIHGFDTSFGVEAEGQQVDFELEALIGDVNQPQTVDAPQNVQPLEALLQNFGIDPSLLNQALGQVGAASGGGGLPQGGGAPAAPSQQDTSAYLQCIQQAQGSEALQQCNALLP
jgi:hypothetical protein